MLREAAAASLNEDARSVSGKIETAYAKWSVAKSKFADKPTEKSSEVERRSTSELIVMDEAINSLLTSDIQYQFAVASAEAARRPLDHKKFLDMLIDEAEEKQIQLLEGTRAHTAVIDDYVKRICTALEDDFNTQFYEPAFRRIREETYHCGTVSLGQIEHTSVLTGNRQFAKVQPQATMEFDLPKRRIMIAEAMAAAQAGMSDYGALLGDPNFLALTKLYSGQPTSSTFSGGAAGSQVRDVLPGLPSQTGESAVIQAQSGQPQFQSQLESLVPDPAIYKFETGTGYEVRPVIQPDGQSVLFDLNYMYTTNVREPVAADEKHLGRVKRHFIDTDVQVGNYELREVSRYRVALKAERSGRGVPLLESIPGAGALFRPVNDGESSLQQNIILAHSVIYPTLFDLMGLRWAPAVADLDEEDIKLQEFTYRNRMRSLKNEVYDYSSSQVDEFLRIPQSERRPDLYRTQVPIPAMHPNGYSGPGNGQYDSILQEGDGMSLPEESIPAEGAVDGSSVDEFPNQSSVVPPGGWGRLRAETAGVRTAKGEASGASAGNSGRVRLEDSRGKPSTARSDARVRTVSRSEQPVRKDGITSRLKSLATGKSSYSP
ncbi:hypothetical protein LBMAG46_41580 [Planctomycetia bacterium]|nr:hypothetical protein LBMAG46_41580 [Planctomycetia bacterium]